MKSGDFVTKLVRNQTDAYPSCFAPKRFRSLQLAPRIPIFLSFLQKLYKSSHYKLFSSIMLMFFINPVPSQVHKQLGPAFWLLMLCINNPTCYTSREDSWFWLIKGHGLIVMFFSLLSDRLLSSLLSNSYGLID